MEGLLPNHYSDSELKRLANPDSYAPPGVRIIAAELLLLRKAVRKIARMTNKEIVLNPWNVGYIARKAAKNEPFEPMKEHKRSWQS